MGGAEHAGTGYEVNETKVELGMLVGGVGYGQRTDAAGNRCARGGSGNRCWNVHRVTRTRFNARRGRPPTRTETSSGIAKQSTHGHCEMNENRSRNTTELTSEVCPLFQAAVHKLVDTSGSKTVSRLIGGNKCRCSPDLCKLAAAICRYRFSPSNGRLLHRCSQIGGGCLSGLTIARA